MLGTAHTLRNVLIEKYETFNMGSVMQNGCNAI